MFLESALQSIKTLNVINSTERVKIEIILKLLS